MGFPFSLLFRFFVVVFFFFLFLFFVGEVVLLLLFLFVFYLSRFCTSYFFPFLARNCTTHGVGVGVGGDVSINKNV